MNQEIGRGAPQIIGSLEARIGDREVVPLKFVCSSGSSAETCRV